MVEVEKDGDAGDIGKAFLVFLQEVALRIQMGNIPMSVVKEYGQKEAVKKEEKRACGVLDWVKERIVYSSEGKLEVYLSNID